MMQALTTMRGGATLLVLLGAVGLGGCATSPDVPPPRTTIVLLPDEDGSVGTVTVSTVAGSQSIDRAYQGSTVVGTRVKPSAPTPLDIESVTATYDTLLQAQPPKPKTFIVRFLLDQAVLTDESQAMIPAVLEAIRERKPTEITVFGHADAIGPEKHNVALSAERARVIATLLRSIDPTLDRIEVQYFGDSVPLFPSDSRTPEPRNRRAEIMIL
jgi:outer membrane protein OmpA-like peptidoglycan-associated protein